jgi:hypothetical protein
MIFYIILSAMNLFLSGFSISVLIDKGVTLTNLIIFILWSLCAFLNMLNAYLHWKNKN